MQEVLTNVTARLGGSSKERGRVLPSHLEGRGVHNLGVGVVAGELQKDIGEVVFIVLGHHHSPEAVFDVELGEKEGGRVDWHSGHSVDNPRQDTLEFLH